MNEDNVPNSQRPKMECLESWSSTLIKVVRLRHTWTINNFSFISDPNGEGINSSNFSSGSNSNSNRLEWRLELYPNGKENNNTDGISLFLVLVDCYLDEINIECKLGIVHPNGKDINIFKDSQLLEEEDPLGCEKFLMKESLLNEKNEVLSGDKLTIFCEISAPIGIENISGTLTTPLNDLAKDFAFLLENEDLSDVTLSTGGKEFLAHKVILIARSPVFRAMFQSEMEESKNNRVEIEDIDDEGLGEMLRYMYTGEIYRLKEMAPRLLAMAEKYEMDGLKIICAKALFESLSLENVVETFILSDMFRVTELKDLVKKFIDNHASDIETAPGFESMIRTHPHLGFEAYRIINN